MDQDALCARLNVAPAEISVSLVMMQLAGSVVRVDGGRYARASEIVTHPSSRPLAAAGGMLTELSPEDSTMRKVIEFLRMRFQCTSRKFLQLHVAAFWCLSDRVRWKTDSVMQACLLFRYVSPEEIRTYVTPPLVKLAV